MKSIMPNSAANHVQRHCAVSARRFFMPGADRRMAQQAERGENPVVDVAASPIEAVLPRERKEEDKEREQAEFLGGRREIRKRAAPQQPARAEVNQAQQRVEQNLPLVAAAVNPAVVFVHFEPEPDAEREQQQDVLRL